MKIFDLVADKCRANLVTLNFINLFIKIKIIYDKCLINNKILFIKKPASDIGIRSISIAQNASCLVAADSAGICHVWTLKNSEV